MRKFAIAACAVATLSLAAPVAAQDHFGYYEAYIGPHDIRNSSGVRLRDMGAILRQDRANVHRYGIVDGFDDIDDVFDQSYLREMLQEAVNDSIIPGHIERAILAGNAYIRVDLYGEGDTLLFVEISRAD